MNHNEDHNTSTMQHSMESSNHNHDEHNSHDHSSHEEHSSHDHSGHAGLFKKKFFISLLFGVPIILLSPMMGKDLFFTITFPGSEWVVAVLATILFFYGGSPFLSGAKDELKNKKPAMMTLISLGISVAYIYSIYAFISNSILNNPNHVMDFFWELASLILIMLLGHWIEMNAISNAGNALQKLAELLPSSARYVNTDGSIEEMPLSHIKVGDTVQVLPGERIPTDGTIIQGSSFVNESMVTGESKDVEKKVDDQLIGGSINGAGTLLVLVSGTGESGYLAAVMQLVSSAQSEKSRAESLSDKVASLLFYFALVVGIISFIIWMLLGNGTDFALERLVTVLIIACPHALGLAVPLVSARSTSIAAKNGLLIQNRQALEAARKIDVIVMDKTGTLTQGDFSVSKYESLVPKYTNEEVLQIMASIEQGSSHPLAVGILDKAQEEQLNLFAVEETTNIPGAGLQALINGTVFKLVSAAYLRDQGIAYDKMAFEDLASLGNSVSYLIEEDEVIAIVGQGDTIKPTSKYVISQLLDRNIRPIMLTGDNAEIANKVAKQLGINEVHAEAKPEDKEALVSSLQSQGLTVMMVGDGVNDAPSLARANVGVAIGAGTDVAIDSADVILVRSDPTDILHFLDLAKNTVRKTIQNLWWGAGYNIIAIPLAGGILAKFGIILSPALGAVLMSLSTVIVAINAITLKIDTKKN